MSKWVLLLGGSTGHGAATAKRLARDGYGIIAFHFDRGEAKKIAEETINEVSEITGGRCHYFNTNAASEETMQSYIPKIKEITKGSKSIIEHHLFKSGQISIQDPSSYGIIECLDVKKEDITGWWRVVYTV